MVSIDRHEQLELIHGRGWLDRLTDDCYAKVLRAEACEEEFDQEINEIIQALCELSEAGLAEWSDYYLSPSNPMRFVSRWKPTYKARLFVLMRRL